MEIRKVAVVGGGRMGRQIALNAAINGYEVKVTDNIAAVLEDIEKWKEQYLAERITKGRMTEQQVADTKARFAVVTSTEAAVCDADLVIEAVLERVELKKEVITEICKYAPKEAIITTNSSRMPASWFRECVNDTSKLCNLHYNNPALVMKAVEIQQNELTSEDTIETLKEFCRSCGKVPLHLRKENDGLIVSHLLGALNHAAMKLVEDGICDIEDVDNGCVYGLGHPMGVFRLNDLTGLDLSYDIRKAKFEKTGIKDPGYDMIEERVKQGRLGKRVGKGWYDYD